MNHESLVAHENPGKGLKRVWVLWLCALYMQRGERIFLVYTQAGWHLDSGEFEE